MEDHPELYATIINVNSSLASTIWHGLRWASCSSTWCASGTSLPFKVKGNFHLDRHLQPYHGTFSQLLLHFVRFTSAHDLLPYLTAMIFYRLGLQPDCKQSYFIWFAFSVSPGCCLWYVLASPSLSPFNLLAPPHVSLSVLKCPGSPYMVSKQGFPISRVRHRLIASSVFSIGFQ